MKASVSEKTIYHISFHIFHFSLLFKMEWKVKVEGLRVRKGSLLPLYLFNDK